ncbi:MAG: phosphatidate cytidylyltransferase [Propionibacteriaceae bacterium]|nr:phosphatidate cytidylyltransferase [Propionibacteriaceae bacterium]
MASKFRDLAMRLVVAAVLIAIVTVTGVWFRWGFVVVLGAFVVIGSQELAHAASQRGWRPVWQVVAVGGAALLIAEYGLTWFAPAALAPLPIGFIGCVLLALVAWGWRLTRPVEGFVADAAVTTFMIAYLPLMATFVVAMARTAHPVGELAVYITCIALNDAGAYFAGSSLGRHHMTPKISPAKTWEGFVGGIVCAGVAGALLVQFVLHAPWWQGVVFGVVLGLCATIGDLIESAMKRDFGVKDMGKLLPGHGGVIDRVDSMLYCAPVAWALLNLWIMVGR